MRLNEAAFTLMKFNPACVQNIEGFDVVYHEDRIYSVRKDGIVHLVAANNPYHAVEKVTGELTTGYTICLGEDERPMNNQEDKMIVWAQKRAAERQATLIRCALRQALDKQDIGRVAVKKIVFPHDKERHNDKVVVV